MNILFICDHPEYITVNHVKHAMESQYHYLKLFHQHLEERVFNTAERSVGSRPHNHFECCIDS